MSRCPLSVPSVETNLTISDHGRLQLPLRHSPAKPRVFGGGVRVSSNRSTATSIALGQSHIWSAKPSPCSSSNRERQNMAWKNFAGPFAFTSRHRVVASALMYGLSLAVRVTSPAGVKNPNAAQSASDDVGNYALMSCRHLASADPERVTDLQAPHQHWPLFPGGKRGPPRIGRQVERRSFQK